MVAMSKNGRRKVWIGRIRAIREINGLYCTKAPKISVGAVDCGGPDSGLMHQVEDRQSGSLTYLGSGKGVWWIGNTGRNDWQGNTI